MKVLAILLLVVVVSATAPFIDSWGLIKDAKCINDNTKSISLLVYLPTGKVSENFTKNAELLKPYRPALEVGGFIMPCVKCEIVKQVADIVDALKKANIVLASIAIFGREWSNDKAKNIDFIKKFVAEYTKSGIHFAFLTSEEEWARVVGLAFTEMSKFPLWWVRHDKDPEAKNFKPFAGWTKPLAKQYDSGEVCGMRVGKDSQYM